MRVTLFILSILLSAPAFAAPITAGTPCAMTEYKESPGVAYEPGVDANGWVVEPAETNPPALTDEDVMNPDIALEVPLDRYTKNKHVTASDSAVAVGTLKSENGTVTLNGKDLQNEDNRECD